MLFSEPQVRIWLYTQPTDMRKSYNGLSALVKNKLQDNPLSGELFVFVNRRQNKMKILYFDRSGKIQVMSTAASSPANTTDSAELVQALSEEAIQLKRQLAWFKQQLFGSKSEKRVIENPEQPLLTGLMGEPVKPLPPGDKQKITCECGKAKKNRDDDCVNDSGLRFGPEVPVKTITLDAPELSGPDAGEYDIIGYKTSHRLAQHHSAYVVLCFQRRGPACPHP